ncbi:ComEC/Rec2 family competence protein [Geodermatophilaceae bacterium NBWT11]|nr:ComEC/Rec2 family competence protein [Geodermatophilaceae bacterium NBWT11]
MQRRRVWERWSWVDLRLVPPALTVWSLTLLLPVLPPPVLLVLPAAAALLALTTGRLLRGPRRWAVVACLAAVAVTAVLASVRAGERSASPLPALADRGGVVEVVLTVDEEPRVLTGGAGPARVLVPGSVTAVVGGPAMRPARVLVFGPADEWDAVLPGTAVTLRASPGRAEDGDDVVAVLSARSPPSTVAPAGAGLQVAADLRRGLADAGARVLPPAPAGLLPGLVVGDTSGMDPQVTADFRRAGLGHLTAVSGANVAIVLALLLWPLRRRLVDRRWQAVVGALGLLGYVVLARPSPSVLRAAAMGAVTLLALASGRSRVAVPALGAAVVVLLLVDPRLAADPGFALSVVATAGIVLLSPGWSRSLRRRGTPVLLADALAVSAAAGLVTAPLVAGFSGLVSVVSLPANLLVAPAVAPATVLGLLATLAGPVSPPVADLLVWAAGWPTRWLVLVADRAAAVPDGAGGWPGGVGGAVLLTALLGVAAVVLVRWPCTRPLALAAVVGGGGARLAGPAGHQRVAGARQRARGLRRRPGRRPRAAHGAGRGRARRRRPRPRTRRRLPPAAGHRPAAAGAALPPGCRPRHRAGGGAGGP